MGKTTDQIAADIDHTRDELKANLQELETRVKDITNWREQFAKRPGAMMAAALAGGVLLSAMIGKR